MKKYLKYLSLVLASGISFPVFATDIWKHADKGITTTGVQKLHPDRYVVYAVDKSVLMQQLQNVPLLPEQSVAITLPMPDGSFRSFHIWQTPVMAPALATRYPGIKTFTATADDNRHVSAKIDITTHGFHAMIFDGNNTVLIDPLTDDNSSYYLSYYKKDYAQQANGEVFCQVNKEHEEELQTGRISIQPHNNGVEYIANGLSHKTYRLALATTYEYSVAVDGSLPTKAGVLSAMVTSINRVNGVYERELSVTLELIDNTDTLISLTATDPYTNSSAFSMLGENQTNVDAKIGTANYDIGHVFSTGGGGVAFPACVCDGNFKARGVTGRTNPIGDPFDIDYVAHEMGHQFGAMHTFNAGTGSCGGGNAVFDSAYEPGSGTTILAYAGICGVNNVQANSDAYFHYRTLEQITDFITTGNGFTCAAVAPSGNTPAVTTPIAASYNIPYLTPFELVAPAATDVNHDELTYCWEEHDLGDFEADFTATTVGPIFRSFTPDTSRTRVFPTLEKLLDNTTSYLGEKLPEVEREMNFRLTVRDILNGLGCVNLSDDEVKLNVYDTGLPFEVKSPNEADDYWQAGSIVTVTWEVANTDIAPVNTAEVDVYLSVDGGHTYPYILASGIANTGTAELTVPAVVTDSARIKVKGAGNVFFDISNQNFYINTWPASVATTGNDNGIILYPVPAKDVLNIDYKLKDGAVAIVVNALGQQVWKGAVTSKMQIPVQNWAKSVYNIRFLNKDNKQVGAKQFVVQ